MTRGIHLARGLPRRDRTARATPDRSARRATRAELGAGLAACAALVACSAPPSAPPSASGDAREGFERRVRVVYFNPADRECLPGYRERLERVVTEIQTWYRDEMERNGRGPLTFPLERDADGRLVVHVVRSRRAYAPGEEIGAGEIRDEHVAPALREIGIDVEREHLIVFANTVFASDEPRGKVLHSWSVYGGLGDHRSGTAWVTDCELLDPLDLDATEPIVWDGGERRYTLGGYNVVYIGGVAHELGHALGLPHDRETPAQRAELGFALMGSGNYHFLARRAGDEQETFLSPAEATLLASHPLFRRDSTGVDLEPEVEWTELELESGRGEYIVRGRVVATPRAYAVVAFHDGLEPADDYDATAWVGAIDDGGRFEVRVGALEPGRYELRLRCCLVNGAQRTIAYGLRLDQELALVRAELERLDESAEDGE